MHKVWLAVDGGIIVTPDAAKANIESGILYGLSSVLHERVTIKDGVVQQSNFHDYNLMRMSDLPEVMQVTFIDRDAPPSGLGEIGNPFIAAAVANALLQADRQAAASHAVHARAGEGSAEGLKLRFAAGVTSLPLIPAPAEIQSVRNIAGSPLSRGGRLWQRLLSAATNSGNPARRKPP